MEVKEIFWKKRATYLQLLERKQRKVEIRLIFQANLFWNYVILTAVDESQKLFYEFQIKEKLMLSQIPLQCQYLVLSDPAGPKVGCGGATIIALQHLQKVEPNWKNRKIM